MIFFEIRKLLEITVFIQKTNWRKKCQPEHEDACEISSECGVSKENARLSLRKNKYKPFKCSISNTTFPIQQSVDTLYV